MKRILVLILLLAVFGLLVLGIPYGRKTQARKKREAAYQTALLSYTQVLKPGMTRKEVEDYLHGRKVNFQQMCCVDATELSNRHSWDDLTKIGKEDPP
jgi:Na+-transporting NADH:ubiquinone oxidoreductase subunit NqrC